MTVITTKSDISFCTPDDKCTVCDKKLWPPFVEWHGRTNIFICGNCCLSIKQGLMADLIQVAAIAEINRLGRDYYSGATLVRKSTKQVEAEALAMNNVDRLRFKPQPK